jgi:predicted transcriptional regulator
MVAKEPPVGVRFPVEIKAALEKLAKADDRSISYVINKIVAEYLRARKLIK